MGGQRFNDRKEVKDIHSYFSILANPGMTCGCGGSSTSLPGRSGQTTVDLIGELAGQEGYPCWISSPQADQYARLSRAVMPLLKFWQIYQRLQDSLENRPLDEFAQDVIELTGYKQMLEQDAAKGHEDAADRLQNLGQLVSNVKSYCDQHGEEASLEGYLEDVALISDIDNYNESADQVVLMTIHSAKGLEFPYVFLIGMEGGVFPSEMSRYSEDDLEEERRLAYVGITRAKRSCTSPTALPVSCMGARSAMRPTALCGRSSRSTCPSPPALWQKLAAAWDGAAAIPIRCPAGALDIPVLPADAGRLWPELQPKLWPELWRRPGFWLSEPGL